MAGCNSSGWHWHLQTCQNDIIGVQCVNEVDKWVEIETKKNDEFFFCVQSIYWSMAQKTWICVLKIKLWLALFNSWVVTVWGEFHVPGKLHMDNQRRKNLTMYSIISIKNWRHQISLFPLNPNYNCINWVYPPTEFIFNNSSSQTSCINFCIDLIVLVIFNKLNSTTMLP